MKKNPTVEFFKGTNRKWRWRLRSGNNRIICSPGEDFDSRRNAQRNFDTVWDAFRGFRGSIGVKESQ